MNASIGVAQFDLRYISFVNLAQQPNTAGKFAAQVFCTKHGKVAAVIILADK